MNITISLTSDILARPCSTAIWPESAFTSINLYVLMQNLIERVNKNERPTDKWPMTEAQKCAVIARILVSYRPCGTFIILSKSVRAMTKRGAARFHP